MPPCRYPVGAEDSAGAAALAVSGQLSPIQKTVVAALAQLAPLPYPELWSEALETHCYTLRPLGILSLRWVWVVVMHSSGCQSDVRRSGGCEAWFRV